MDHTPRTPEEDAIHASAGGFEGKDVCYAGLWSVLGDIKRDLGDNKKVRFGDLRALFDEKSTTQQAYTDSVHYTHWGYEQLTNATMATFGDHIVAAAKAAEERGGTARPQVFRQELNIR